MHRKFLVGLPILMALGVMVVIMFSIASAERGPAGAAAIPALPTQLPSSPQEPLPGVNAPNISFIDSPTATCYQPAPQREPCILKWGYLYVTASSSQYIISMTVSIDDRLRGYYAGFFQTYMYVPSDMQRKGFIVACGQAGASGNPLLGMSHGYILRAKETGGLQAANYGSVTCPAAKQTVYLPLTSK